MLDNPLDQLVINNLFSKTSYCKDDILRTMSDAPSPLEGFIALQKYSLTLIVKKIFKKGDQPLELLPFQSALLWMLWTHKYPMVLASRGAGKTFIYALYALLRAILIPGSQICIVGAGFRQAKLVFNYIANFYYSSPLLQEALKDGGGPKYAVDQCSLKVGSSNIFAIPLGDGERIRGLRANVILCDEFASIPEEIYEIVVQPFAAVHSDPARRVKMTNLINKLKKHNAPEHIIKMLEDKLGFGNQICISGTATYEFNHFYRKYEMYRKIIFSRGDRTIIAKAFAEGNKHIDSSKVEEDMLKTFKHVDYAIFQLPWHAIPEGFMDAGIIANARLTYEPHRFNMEYLCKFARDSDGFYKRSLIDAATPKERDSEVRLELFGERGAQYVMGVDPARHNDNFAIVILKLTGRGYEVVYSWSIRGKAYDIAARKIKELVKRFNIIYIAMDQGGGGDHVADLLCNKDLLEKDELPIWRMDDDDTKFFDGLHIIDMFQWSNEWVRDNNHAMRSELMQQQLLFPYQVDIELATQQFAKFFHKPSTRLTEIERNMIDQELFGSVNEDDVKIQDGVWDNVQEVINEMCAIIVKVSENGTEQFILPSLSVQQKNQSSTDARRRDRYSALLLAAYAARMVRGNGFKKKDVPGGSEHFFRKSSQGGTIRRSSGGVVYPNFG